MPATGDPGYALSSAAEHEHERLSRQSVLYEPFTRRLLLRAGIEPGMRVLDVGCGPGDVSFLRIRAGGRRRARSSGSSVTSRRSPGRLNERPSLTSRTSSSYPGTSAPSSSPVTCSTRWSGDSC